MAAKPFDGVRAAWFPLYEQIRKAAVQALGEFEEHETSKAVIWRHNAGFAEFSARKDCFMVTFFADRRHDEWQPAKTLQTSKNRVAHSFAVTGASRFPEFIKLIQASYALTRSSRLRRETPTAEYSTIDEYIARFPEDTQTILRKIRKTIHRAAPRAVEKISWRMPTFYQKENLVHFAAAKNHVGFYPGADGVAAFEAELGEYPHSKGAIQFPFAKPIPYDLIERITRYREEQQHE
jgi:uncharacterized protein YdhG (YjbR/CyaY superfamily)